MDKNTDPEANIRKSRRKIRRRCLTDGWIHIVFEGLKGEESIAGLRCRGGPSPNRYSCWRKEFP